MALKAFPNPVLPLRSSGTCTKVSGAVLSIVSPVWQAKLWRGVQWASKTRLDLTADDAASFPTLLKLACGRPSLVSSLAALLDLGRLADAYGIEHVHRATEWEALRRLSVDRCAELLVAATAAGMPALEAASRELAVAQLDSVAGTLGFAQLSEEGLCAVLDDATLAAVPRDAAATAVARWARPSGDGTALRSRALPARVALALASGDGRDPGLSASDPNHPITTATGDVDSSANSRGGGGGGPRLRYEAGIPRRVQQPRMISIKTCLAVGQEAVACGFYNGALNAVRRADLAPLKHNPAAAAVDSVSTVAVWGAWIASGRSGGEIDIWQIPCARGGVASCPRPIRPSASTLECIGTIDTGSERILALCVTGEGDGGPGRLVSASQSAVKVWAAGTRARTWVCECTVSSSSHINCLTAWDAFAATGGCYTGKVDVWNLASGALEATLSHESDLRSVISLAADPAGGRLITASEEATGIVRIWRMGLWTCEHQLSVSGLCKVVVSAGLLFGGMSFSVRRGHTDAERLPVIQVLNLDTLALETELRMADDLRVGLSVNMKDMVVSRAGDVWAIVDNELFVWGWKPTAGPDRSNVKKGIKSIMHCVGSMFG